MLKITSLELCRTALFSALLAIVEIVSFSYIYPVFPPIVAVPFVTAFVLAFSIPFVKHQWLLSFVAAALVILRMGNLLPGPLIIPVYGFLFQIRKVKLSGALSAILHVIYGIFLAPLLFSVAPATILYKVFQDFFSSFAVAFVVVILLFGVGGAVASSLGYKIGLTVANKYFHLDCGQNSVKGFSEGK